MDLLISFLIIILLNLILMALITPLPISDTGVVRYRTLPLMTMALITVNALVFTLWQARTLYGTESIAELQSYVDQVWRYGYRESFMRDGTSIGAFTTFTSMFMHADFWHLFGNMIFLWTFGRRVEDACGAWRFLLYYLAAGMVANLGSVVLNPSHSDIPSIGASGAISGVMGAYLVLFPGAKVQCLWVLGSGLRIPFALILGRKMWSWTISLPAWVLLIYYAVSNALPSFDVMQNGSDVGGVNTLAHLMGFLGAAIILLYVRKDLLLRYLAGRRL
jgi:membrane associated rhomboid family serine protease